jgi:hypothetical protein
VILTLLLICANEEKSGHLDEFLRINLSIFDNLIAYDDASFDSTPSHLLDSGFTVITGEFSKFKNELMIRQELVQHAMKIFPQTEWFFILDSDELLLASREEIESLIREAEKRDCDGISFHLVNLWKSRTQFRTDELFNKVRKVHAWRNNGELMFSRESGLHRELHPINLRRILDQSRISILHLGFSSFDLIVSKFVSYSKLGQRGRMLWRLIDERGLLLDVTKVMEALLSGKPLQTQEQRRAAHKQIGLSGGPLYKGITTPRHAASCVFLYIYIYIYMYENHNPSFAEMMENEIIQIEDHSK